MIVTDMESKTYNFSDKKIQNLIYTTDHSYSYTRVNLKFNCISLL